MTTPRRQAPAHPVCRIGGRGLRCGAELWRAPERLFDAVGGKGLHAHILAAVEQCDVHSRTALLGNVLLAGGSTCFPGFEARLQVRTK